MTRAEKTHPRPLGRQAALGLSSAFADGGRIPTPRPAGRGTLSVSSRRQAGCARLLPSHTAKPPRPLWPWCFCGKSPPRTGAPPQGDAALPRSRDRRTTHPPRSSRHVAANPTGGECRPHPNNAKHCRKRQPRTALRLCGWCFRVLWSAEGFRRVAMGWRHITEAAPTAHRFAVVRSGQLPPMVIL